MAAKLYSLSTTDSSNILALFKLANVACIVYDIALSILYVHILQDRMELQFCSHSFVASND